MDVDLLRPGTVPINPETVLWFEFLLNKELLLQHLQKPNPDPSPIELINKFTIAVFESFKNEARRVEMEGVEGINVPLNENNPDIPNRYSKKNIALKILSLKVAAYIKWNIVSLMALPFKIQVSVLQDLIYFTHNHISVELPNLEEHNPHTISPQHKFSLVIYYRWLICLSMRRVFCQMPPPRPNGEMTMEENYFCTEENIQRCIQFLVESLSWEKSPPMLNYECFVMLSEDTDDIEHTWDQAEQISKYEYDAQIHYELGCFFFYKENYDLAKNHFKSAMDCYRFVKTSTGFMYFNVEELQGYLMACQASPEESNKNLLHLFSICVANHYMGIVNILVEDNKYREIPLPYRINLELDIQSALSSGKFTVARDLLPKIHALNTIRCIIDEKGLHKYMHITERNQEFLIWAAAAVWDFSSVFEKQSIAAYFAQLSVSNKMPEFLKKFRSQEIFRDIAHNPILFEFEEHSADIKIPSLLENSSWDYPELTSKRNPKLEIRALEQQIIMNYDPINIRDLLVKITMKNSNRPVWKLNPKWELPIPLQSVIVSLQRGFLQDYAFILLAKSRELIIAKDWSTSLLLLKALESEIKDCNSDTSQMNKLAKLLTWEILLVEVTQLLEECPAPQIDKQALATACKNCLETNDSILPRTEVIEQCVLCLLNLGYWDFLYALDKRVSYFEFAKAIISACQELNKFKGEKEKRFPKDLWDLTLPAFISSSSSSQTKRSASGSSVVVHRDSPINNTKNIILSFFTRLRDGTALRVVISLLAKLHNILRDEAPLELNTEYINFWPSVVSNPLQYSSETVTEVLSQIVEQALKFYPHNLSWLRLMGDINFATEKYEHALNYYLKSLITAYEYFIIPIRSDDFLFRRMIKSSASLGCYTQAAVLCQFLENPDYLSAFHYLSEQKSCNDAVDAYYNYFWDTNILEYLIHTHNKKGEFQRRKRAIESIGLLELNSNNNEEIVREASNYRKTTFLRALCKQYVH
nr:integrator complex subunit 8 [Onthophagus taurus]